MSLSGTLWRKLLRVDMRLGISTTSLYTWKARFAKSPRVRSNVAEQAAKIRRLRRELARVTEKRTINHNVSPVIFPRQRVKNAFENISLYPIPKPFADGVPFAKV